MNISGNTILITGGGSGIGRDLALRLNALGNTVIVAGRRIGALREVTAGRGDMHAFELDLEDPEAISAFAVRVIAEHPDLNVLVNNAGIMRFEDVSGSRDLADAEAQVVTNLLGPIRLTNALIDHLRRRPGSVILNVSSGLAFVPRSDAATYCATKAALHVYTLCLREELRGAVEVIELVPPFVQTQLTLGQAGNPAAMPLGEFTDEALQLLTQDATPSEVLVQRVNFQRLAEREGRFAQTFETVNTNARAGRR